MYTILLTECIIKSPHMKLSTKKRWICDLSEQATWQSNDYFLWPKRIKVIDNDDVSIMASLLGEDWETIECIIYWTKCWLMRSVAPDLMQFPLQSVELLQDDKNCNTLSASRISIFAFVQNSLSFWYTPLTAEKNNNRLRNKFTFLSPTIFSQIFDNFCQCSIDTAGMLHSYTTSLPMISS